jgi:predicted nucleic acid-binding protein
MVLLDASIIAELMRPTPDPRVEAWLTRQRPMSVYISAITEAELRHRIARIDDPRQRARLENALSGVVEEDFFGRVLPFDGPAAQAYAEIVSTRSDIAQSDAQQAAIAKSRGSKLATNRVADFERCGIETIDPWKSH